MVSQVLGILWIGGDWIQGSLEICHFEMRNPGGFESTPEGTSEYNIFNF